MASIVLLLSELLGGESASVLAANRYMCGQSPGEFRPAVTSASAKQDRRAAGADHAAVAAAAGTGREERRKEESLENLVMSRIAVDVMWP